MIVKDEELLRKSSEPVTPDEVSELREKLEKELQQSARRGRPGIGLAAPQIGIQKRMAIVRIKNIQGKEISLDLVNPEIIEKNDLVEFDEGCLSFPGKSVKTHRYQEVRVKSDVEPHEFVATGLIAVCIQHEIDHLDGILMMDRAIDS